MGILENSGGWMRGIRLAVEVGLEVKRLGTEERLLEEGR